tara:strand:- start:128 stop:382 length:255 start_codon:yes stop_codon:yes gene_type:complete
MKVGDLVTWKEAEDNIVCFPWHYNRWRDIGIIVQVFDKDAVIVQWASGDCFSVWKMELQLLSVYVKRKKIAPKKDVGDSEDDEG